MIGHASQLIELPGRKASQTGPPAGARLPPAQGPVGAGGGPSWAPEPNRFPYRGPFNAGPLSWSLATVHSRGPEEPELSGGGPWGPCD